MIAIKVIMPKELLFEPERLEKAITNALDGAALGAKSDFQVTTETWEHKPDFVIQKDGFRRIIYTASVIYKDVNDGTERRFVIMTHNFQAKTVPHQLRSRAGRGGVLARTNKPQPGIEAREFDKEVAKKWTKELPRILQRAIDAAVSRQH